MPQTEPGAAEAEIHRISPEGRVATTDSLAREEPLEIRVCGDPLAVTMRTPGDDLWLTAGFLLAEGIIDSLDDVGRIYHCGAPGTPEAQSTVDVLPAPGAQLDLDRIRPSKRGTLVTAACGVCGRQSIDDLLDRCGKVESAVEMPEHVIAEAVSALRDRQPIFAATGGVHAVGIFDAGGELLLCCEDIGRHNAADKAIGALLYKHQHVPEDAALMVLSGRASFEMIQKAAVAGIPFVASVSAASSLSVSLARSIGITLMGFVRNGSMNVYAHPERILA